MQRSAACSADSSLSLQPMQSTGSSLQRWERAVKTGGNEAHGMWNHNLPCS